MKRIIALIDCDSFFVSCEQALNKDLKGKPVCVLSNNDGCVVSRSKEAKKLGIKMGMPYFMAKKEFPNGIYLSGNHTSYKNFSKKVMNILKEFSPDVEICSIDEAYIDLTGTRKLYKKNYIEIAKSIRERILSEIDIPVSIGISTSKTLAKLASDKAKMTNGIYTIGTRKILKEMEHTAIEEICGIGKQTMKSLHKKGILKCSQLIELPDSFLKANFGINGVEIKHELLGEVMSPVNPTYKLPKSIQDTAAFGIFTDDYNYIKKELNKHIHIACRKLRKDNGYASEIGVMLRTKDFKIYWAKESLNNSTNFEIEISQIATKLLNEIYVEDTLYRATGVYLKNLSFKENHQTSLFDNQKQSDNNKLAKTIDNLENKFGKNIIRIGF